jgi:hypothetical protein
MHAPAEVRDVYRDAVNAALARCTPLHFSWHGWRRSRPPNRHPFRGQPDYRQRKIAAITATVSMVRLLERGRRGRATSPFILTDWRVR